MTEDFLDEEGKWKCIKCGACCKMAFLLLPEYALPNGHCKYLIGTECAIYSNRPDICNVQRNRGTATEMDLANACDYVKGFTESNYFNGG